MSMAKQDGFTLLELIVMMVVIGVLAAYVSARLDFAEHDANGFAEEAKALVRYVQKVAVAQRRSIQVSVTNGTGGNGGNAKLAAPAIDPSTASNIEYQAPKGVSVAATPTEFSFDALGRASAAATITVSGGSVTRKLYVEQETGYVHE